MPKRIWQQCTRDPKAGRWAAIYATMNPQGVIHISRRTYELLGEPEAFNLLFDRINTTIGLQPTRKVMKNAFSVQRRGHDHGRIIRAFGFAQEFRIRLNETVRFAGAEVDED